MSKYKRYQDYVITDGKLIGEFEQMYRDFEDPWEQTTRESFSLEKKLGLELLKRDNRKNPLEYGCGFGDYTDELRKVLGFASGVDLSETAINKAKQRHPLCNFYQGDLLDFNLLEQVNPDVIMLVEISWYVLEKLANFKSNIKRMFGGRDVRFLHNLMTYAKGTQKYGVDYFTNLDEIIEYWSDVIDIQEWGSMSKTDYNGGARTFIYGSIK
jgi:hypothetical protein